MRRTLFLTLILPVAASGEETVEPLASHVPKFVENYCLECHDDLTAKGDRDFIPFLEDPHSPEQFLALEEILDQLNLGEMPPEKNGVEQPSDEEKRAVIEEITRYLLAEEASVAPDETVLRRLTRYEYNHTMRDLLGVLPDAADATVAFPVDERSHGFATVGETQVLSEHQMGLYLQSARTYLDQVLVFGQKEPEVQRYEIAPSEFAGGPQTRSAVAYRALADDGSYVDIGHGEPADRRVNVPKSLSQKGVPHSGVYRIRVTAQGMGRLNHGYDPEVLGIDTTQPIKLGIWFGRDRSALEKSTTRGRQLIRVVALPDEQAESYEAEAWMPAGAVPFFNWINGPGAAKRATRMVTEAYHPEADPLQPTEVDAMREAGETITDEEVAKHNASVLPLSAVYRGPRMRLHDIVIEGPLPKEWPPASHRALVGEVVDAADVDVAEAMHRLAERAFRRPVAEGEIAHHVKYVEQAKAAGEDPAEALKSGFSAILSSPHFLYLNEGNADRRRKLSPYQLVSRLSYFLWSSMPDAELLAAAESGEIRRKAVLQKQVDRMLADPRAKAFHEYFTEAWLRLDKLGSMPPGTKQFPTYLRRRLEDAMRTETRMLFGYILDENRPITEFIEADYSFLNDSLSEHYGVDAGLGEAFERVSMPAEARRHGILGHASVLTASANGVETSPVVRGVWVLESVLGTPPPPPPPDVPPIEPDTRGATTIREQLVKHREVTSCADCHAKIDPWGFALEFYDPIGGLRTHYPVEGQRGRGPEIDGSSELPSGQIIADEVGLRDAVLERQDQFARNLTTKLLIHGVGRETGFQDQAEIDRIASRGLEQGSGFRDLIHDIVASSIFQSR